MTLSAHNRIRFESVKQDLRPIFFATASRIRESGLPPAVTEVTLTGVFNEWESLERLFDRVLEHGSGGDDEDVLRDLARVEQMREELADIIASNRRR